MTAGFNLRVKFIRYIYQNDDEVGGAVPSGTVLHESVAGRIQASPPVGELVQQGLETNKTMTGVFEQVSDLREFDECEVIAPIGHPYLGMMFRIHTVQYPNNHPQDRRNYILATLTRVTRHAEPYQ